MPRMLTADSTVLQFSDAGIATVKFTNAADVDVAYKVLCSYPTIRTTPTGVVAKKDSLELRFVKDPVVKVPSDVHLEIMWKGILFPGESTVHWSEGGSERYGLEGVVLTVKA